MKSVDLIKYIEKREIWAYGPLGLMVALSFAIPNMGGGGGVQKCKVILYI